MITFISPVQNYLMKEGVPVLKKVGNNQYFRKSSTLQRVLEDAPLWVKILSREGGISY